MDSSRGNSLSEKELVRLVRKGDASGTRWLYERYAGYLTAVCARYMGDRDAVKDVLQEAFVKIFSGFGRFEYRGEGSLKAWVTRIAVNGALKSLRHSGRLVYTEALPEAEDPPDEALPFADVPLPVIQDMIRRLPDGYRTVFNLYVFEDMKHKDIAALLGIKEDSSASQLSRAKALLVKEIKDYQRKHDNG